MVRKRNQLIIVSNRGPFRSTLVGGRRRRVRAAGGLVAALDPVLRQRGGVWVSSLEADAEPPDGDEDIGYATRAVPLGRTDRENFYQGISNAMLWPVMHSMPPTVRISPTPWRSYEKANRAFCDVVVECSRPTDTIWVQDFHLMLLPGMLRERRAKARIGWFCHIPWPGSDLFQILPWHRQLLQGLMGADLIGFHTESYAQNFMACVASMLSDAKVDQRRGIIRYGGRQVQVTVAPIGVPMGELQTLAGAPVVAEFEQRIRSRVQGRRIILGVDRLDYTKGIPQRMLAFEQLLRSDRSARNRYVMIQVMVPSRTDVKAYAELKVEIDRLVGDINGRYSSAGRVPIQYIYRNLEQAKLMAHYLAADVALVTALRDGMNLVALEYCASRIHGGGALVLSEFAGAAQYLTDALIVNPYDISALSSSIRTALSLPKQEAQRRMNGLRAATMKLDVHRWADGYLELLDRVA